MQEPVSPSCRLCVCPKMHAILYVTLCLHCAPDLLAKYVKTLAQPSAKQHCNACLFLTPDSQSAPIQTHTRYIVVVLFVRII